jgi:hypothetical protein
LFKGDLDGVLEFIEVNGFLDDVMSGERALKGFQFSSDVQRAGDNNNRDVGGGGF